MHVKSTLLAGLLASGAMGATIAAEPFRCGTKSTEAHRRISMQFAKEEALARKAGERAVQDINVDVYMHVVAKSKSDKIGNLSRATLQKQLDVMNKDFAPSGISFNLKGVDTTYNARWATERDTDEMQSTLHRGSYRDLNLYFLTELDGFGVCTLPERVGPNDDISFDGCLIRSDTVPGGAATNYNLGKTVTHETGHWFGLEHTFEGGCGGQGDFVDDTPEQASASKGCPVGRDSCPAPGLDPIHNYMDYSYDSCYEEFTAGQTARMQNFWKKYRADF